MKKFNPDPDIIWRGAVGKMKAFDLIFTGVFLGVDFLRSWLDFFIKDPEDQDTHFLLPAIMTTFHRWDFLKI